MHDFDLCPDAFTNKAKREQITPAREAELFAAFRQGDPAAQQQLLQGVRWVAATCALKHCRDYKVMEHFYDLYMEGQMATVKSMETFKPEHGSRFAAYAHTSCDRAMKNYIRFSTGSIVRDMERFTDENGKRSRTSLQRNVDHSLDKPLSDGVGSGNYYDVYPDLSLNPEMLAQANEINERLQQAFTRLSDRERLVVEDCILGDHSLASMCEQFGNISTERVRQIGAAAIKKLGESMFDPNLMTTNAIRKKTAAPQSPQVANNQHVAALHS